MKTFLYLSMVLALLVLGCLLLIAAQPMPPLIDR